MSNNLEFQCPTCKKKLNNMIECNACSKNYTNNLGFIDFIDSSGKQKNEKRFSQLLTRIQEENYSIAVQEFIKKYPNLTYKFNKREGYIAFHAIHKNNKKCLILNSDLGNIPESLSNIVDEIYSVVDSHEKVLIQKFRMQEKNIKNVVLVKSDFKSLPFSNNFFDFIILNGMENSSEKQFSDLEMNNLLKEIQRVLKANGCFCAALSNKIRIGKMFNQTEGNSLEKYTNNFFGYRSILHKTGFKIKTYWTLPSYKTPHFSGYIEDGDSLKWLFQNSHIFSGTNEKNLLTKIFKKMNSSSSKILMKLFCPSFLFYCYNDKKIEDLESMIEQKMGFKKIIQLIRPQKIIYILLDKFGKPKKKVFFNFTKYNLDEKILIKNEYEYKKSLNSILIEDWSEGRPLDPSNKQDILLLLDWLKKFQKDKVSGVWNINEIKEEINEIKNYFYNKKEMSEFPIKKWCDEYLNYIQNIELAKTRVHGNLHPNHVIINTNNSSVKVIDWDDFTESGNPIFDYMRLIVAIMLWSPNPLEEFKSNLDGVGKSNEITNIIKLKMNQYLKKEINLEIMLKYFILNWIVNKAKKEFEIDVFYVKLLRMFL